jgi:hypothetical protein
MNSPRKRKCKPSQHGGKRNGSGRKSLGKARYTLYLTPSFVEAAKAKHGNVSAHVDRLLAIPSPSPAIPKITAPQS